MRNLDPCALRENVDELVRNDLRFQALVRLTSQVIWTSNADGRIEGAQPGWSAFTGQSAAACQGVGWSAAVHPDDVQPTIDEWKRCIADRRPFLFEHRVRRHDGVYRICTINAAPILDDDGTIREWVGVHNDITERRRQEDDLKAEQAKFRLLAESLPQIVWTATPDGTADYYNRAWFDYSGLTLEQSQQRLGSVNASLESGTPLATEIRLRRASDRTYRWHLVRAVPLRDARGTIVKWLGTATDVEDLALQDNTARKRAERELFDQNELLRVTLDSIGDAVITTDAQGRVQSLNPVAALLTGRVAHESRGLPVEQVFDIVDTRTQQRTLELRLC